MLKRASGMLSAKSGETKSGLESQRLTGQLSLPSSLALYGSKKTISTI